MSAPILNPDDGEIVIFFGPRGTGKSSLMGHFADEYLKTLSKQRWELSERLIREKNAKRKTPLSFPNAPPMYANTKYKLKTRTGADFEPIPITGKELGLNGYDDNEYKTLLPAPFIAIDEAHNEFCSKGEKLPDGQFQFFMKCRHHRVILLLAAPRAVLLNKDIRASGSRFIEPREMVNQFDAFKRLYKTEWHCREFLHTSAIEEYIATDGKSGNYINTVYTHNGDIREIYDGFAFDYEFYPPEGEDFET